LFIGEMWVEKRKGNGTQTHRAFTLGSEVKKGKRIVVYWRKRLDGEVEVIRDDKNVVVVNVWGKKLGGVYADGKLRMADWERWLGVTNPDPDLELTLDLPAPVLYWQPMQLPSYFRVHLDLVMTQQDLYLLTLFLWILFSG